VSAPCRSTGTGTGAQVGADGRAGAGARTGEAGWGSIGWLLVSVEPVGGRFRWFYEFITLSNK
jgi:hypothetical protein